MECISCVIAKERHGAELKKYSSKVLFKKKTAKDHKNLNCLSHIRTLH